MKRIIKNQNNNFYLDTGDSPWQKIMRFALIGVFCFQIIFALITQKICQDIGFDYCAYWSAGEIIRDHGFSEIYDLDRLTQYQEYLYASSANDLIDFNPVEVPYLPIFIIPFWFLSHLKINTSYVIWMLLNLAGFVFYCQFFIKKSTENEPPCQLIFLFSLSMPVFINLYQGQLNVLLAICAGEFFRASLLENEFKSGLWLGGWLLKPQLLVLILPYIILRKNIKALSGFILSSLIVVSLSLALAGVNGLTNLTNIMIESAGGGATSNPGIMINWRMIGNNIGILFSPTIGQIFTITGTLITVIITLFLFARKEQGRTSQQIIAYLGIFAATCAVTWHAHIHMAMILIPPMLYLLMQDHLSQKLFHAWVFTPVLIQLLHYVIGALIVFNILPYGWQDFVTFTKGLPLFVLNLLILTWAKKAFTQTSKFSH